MDRHTQVFTYSGCQLALPDEPQHSYVHPHNVSTLNTIKELSGLSPKGDPVPNKVCTASVVTFAFTLRQQAFPPTKLELFVTIFVANHSNKKLRLCLLKVALLPNPTHHHIQPSRPSKKRIHRWEWQKTGTLCDAARMQKVSLQRFKRVCYSLDFVVFFLTYIWTRNLATNGFWGVFLQFFWSPILSYCSHRFLLDTLDALWSAYLLFCRSS